MPKRRPNNNGSIGPYGKGWRGSYTDPITHKQRAVYAKTQAECMAKMDAKLAEIRNGSYVAPDKMTVEAWLLFWFDNFYRRSVKTSTAATAKSNLDKLTAALGKIKLQKLSTVDIQRFVTKELDEGRRASTIKRYLTVLTLALDQARELNKINSNPVEHVKLPKEEKKEIPFLTREEQTIFLAACPASTNGRALRLLLATGLRVSELCGLQWQDIKEDGLHIKRLNMTIKDLQEDGYINVTSTPKTAAGKRIVPLTPSLRSLLEEQRQLQLRERLKAGSAWASTDAGRGSAYIFANKTGKPSDRHNLNRAFAAILDKAKLPRRGVHALRHTFATNWVQQNPDIAALSKILGHTDTAFTYKTYCHADQRSMNQGMAAMEALLQSMK